MKYFNWKKMVNYEKYYVVNEIIMKNGYLPLCLPLHHPDLNPIELVWREITGKMVPQNIGSSSSIQQKE